ncbi:MAG: hypothetical protein KDE48_19825 [Anaerolineales bacterium]|nr:hypothetical protein [Anaerolineales bacterium]
MRKTPFVWLGSGRARKRDVGAFGILLDAAMRGRLPVPNGGILLDDFYQIVREEEVVVVENGRISIPDPNWLYNVLYRDIRFPHLTKLVALRPLFSAPDSLDSKIGKTHLDVDFDDAFSLAYALESVWSPALDLTAEWRRDLLVFEMVERQVGGTAVTQTNQPTDEIYCDEDDHSFHPQKLKGFIPQVDQSLPIYVQRLQYLLSGIRRTLGKGNWAIEWIDDGEICWLVQISECKLPSAR